MKILIIRFSSIGDIVLTSPVMRCIKKQFPEIEIHYLTKKQFEPLIADNPNIDKCFYLKEKESTTISELKKENYDQVIDLHNNLRTFKFRTALRTQAFTLNKLNFEKWAKVTFKWDSLPDVHIVDRYMEVVKHLGVVNDNLGLDFFIHPDNEVELEELPQRFQSGFHAVVIGATYFTKRIPTGKLIAVCKESQLPVVIIGGKGEFDMGEEIKSTLGEKAFNACGKLNLQQSASVIRQATNVLTGDTGMMHIAAAFNKKVISLWGNTIPEFGMYPYIPQKPENVVIIENKELSCRPCSKLGYHKCPKKHFKCMQDLDEKMIAQKLNEV